MPDRDEIRIRRSTNLYDLLDDGIANNSDIRELVRREDATAIEAKHATEDATPQSPQRRLLPQLPRIEQARSWFGILLGILVLVAGSEVALHPIAMLAWHMRRGLWWSTEYVSIDRARFYGICIATFGLLLLVYSLIRMPVADKE